MKKEDFKEGARFRVEGDDKTIYTVHKLWPEDRVLIVRSRKKRLEGIADRVTNEGVRLMVPVMNHFSEVFILFSRIILLKNKTNP